VATAITKAALFEHLSTSKSLCMIRFTLVTSIKSVYYLSVEKVFVHGNIATPVTSSGGGMAVLLYGIFNYSVWRGWPSKQIE
jgi:hypothetical protein